MAHTPGPWEVSEFVDNVWSGSPWENNERLVGTHSSFSIVRRESTPEASTLIAEINQTVRNPLRPPVDQIADARLMAAAPDLLASLVNLLRETDDGTQLCARRFAEEAKAAICKATGVA